jgi:hypothetical protein
MTCAYAAFIPNMQADAAAGVDAWLRQALTEEVGGKSVAIVNLGEGDLDRERNSDARVSCPLAHDLDVDPVHELVRDVGVMKAL